MQCVIIGSFRKHYDYIHEIITLFESHNIKVLSPKRSFIVDKSKNFVLFEYDNNNLLPEEIQMQTFEKMFKSDFVYVCNPDGYVGKTTCYEIGVISMYGVPIFFKEKPLDLPYPNIKNSIISPGQLIYYLEINLNIPILSLKSLISGDIYETYYVKKSHNLIKSKERNKNIVICGSMTFYHKMLDIQNNLAEKDIHSIVPEAEDSHIKNLSEKEFNEFKRRVSTRYLAKIRGKGVYGILVINEEKHGKTNYIGANTLVEIAMAFSWSRNIFLLNDIYEPLKDELIAWNVKTLHGNIMKFIEIYNKNKHKNINQQKAKQLSIFDERYYHD